MSFLSVLQKCSLFFITSSWTLIFCTYSVWYILLLLAAGSISKKNGDKGLPATLCLIFHMFLILCPIRSVSFLTNSCCTEWCRFLITTLYARCCRGWYVWNPTFSLLICLLLFCDIPVFILYLLTHC